MANRKEVQELLDQVADTPGWTVDSTVKGMAKVIPPDVNADPIIVSFQGGSYKLLANLKGDLRRRGWSEDLAEYARQERRAQALKEDRERNEEALKAATAKAKAAQKASRAAKEAAALEEALAEEVPAPVVAVAPPKRTAPHTPTAPVIAVKAASVPVRNPAPVIVNPFIKPIPPETHVPQNPPNLDGYRSEKIYATKEWAETLLERRQCRQRRVSDANMARLQQSMENGEFIENPADHIVTDEHGCVVNGQHRLWAVVYSDDALFARHYPRGVPMYITYDYPSSQVNVFDTGKARSVADTLNVDGLKRFGSSNASALRLAMNFDRSFELDPNHPNRKPKMWRENVWTNTEFVEAARTRYSALPDFDGIAQRLYKKAGLTRTAGTVAAFLIERDNPGGDPNRPGYSNEDFWDGMCFEVTLSAGDARGALYRYLQNQRAQKSKPTVMGPLHLAHVLRQYANWHLDVELTLSSVNDNWLLPPVWRPGYRWITGELRESKRPTLGRGKQNG